MLYIKIFKSRHEIFTALKSIDFNFNEYKRFQNLLEDAAQNIVQVFALLLPSPHTLPTSFQAHDICCPVRYLHFALTSGARSTYERLENPIQRNQRCTQLNADMLYCEITAKLLLIYARRAAEVKPSACFCTCIYQSLSVVH